ncbi:MAG: DUF367 family protein [Candidatus Bathyarchaeota archaeon]|nr:DUF367 family protein [Candidatus Bathyarchaeota archaeon]
MTNKPNLYVYCLNQDDPKKCTARKLQQFGLAKIVRHKAEVHKNAILLNPFATTVLTPLDSKYVAGFGVVSVDCSWKKVKEVFHWKFKGLNRRLPLLIPANPINYGHAGKLSSLEALAAAIYISGFKKFAEEVLSIYRWGEVFLTLNKEPLEDYSKAKSMEDILRLEQEYFPVNF